MKFQPKLPSWIRNQKRFTKYLLWAVSVLVLVLFAGTASAALGGPKVISLLSFGTKPTTQHPIAHNQGLPTPTPTTPTPASSPSPTPAPSASTKSAVAPAGGVTVAGNSYGQHLVNEPTATIWSTKPLVLSTYSITVPAGTDSPGITAMSPDGYPLCLISGLTPDENIAALYYNISSPASCGPAQVFNVQVAKGATPGAYTLHLQVETDNVHLGATKYVHYDGYITVTVTPYTMPYPTMAP